MKKGKAPWAKTPPDTLLSRDAFTALVLGRADGKCVLCGEPAVNAHHVLDRKLYTDGGYYLGNGAAVCGRCHWGCETTQVSVEEVRAAAGILFPVLPPGFDAAVPYDKWGNAIRADGTRSPGPLFGDDGCRKALAAGRVIHLVCEETAPWLP